MKHKFVNQLMEIYKESLNEQLSIKYFSTIAFGREILRKWSDFFFSATGMNGLSQGTAPYQVRQGRAAHRL